jgi:hypothetical protein
VARERITVSPISSRLRRLRGCGWTLVEALTKDDPETLAMWRKEVTAPGAARTAPLKYIIATTDRVFWPAKTMARLSLFATAVM